MKLRDYLKKAKEERFAIGQFNFSTLDQFQAISRASLETGLPVIAGTSMGESRFLGLKEAVSLAKIERERGANVFLNLDHGNDLDYIKEAIDLGYDMVHFDGSFLSFEENVEKTKEVIDYAKERGVIVEGEIGKIEGNSEISKERIESNESLTSDEEIVKFIKWTNLEVCAFPLGNVHGSYPEMPDLNFEKLSKIKEESEAVLVLHGGTGIKEEDISRLIEEGISKININTEIREIWARGVKESHSLAPYKILEKVREETFLKVKEKILFFRKI